MSATSKKATKRQATTGRFLKKGPRIKMWGTGAKASAAAAIRKHNRQIEVQKPERESLAERARRAAAAITDEEDAAITAGAMADPDALPNRFIGKRRGRPRLASTKELVTLRLDPDVLAHFKADGDGWQTRMNDALRKAAGLD